MSKRLFKMCEKLSKVLREIFSKCVSSVQIPNIIKNNIHYDKNVDILQICNVSHNLVNKNVHIVGAGKAVFKMAIEVETMLGSKLKSGIVSIPMGAYNKTCTSPSSVIQFYEGAENNIPDVNSENTTKKIMNLVKSLDENCVLIVLLSGGGSALLPAPLHPVTLDEKSNLIKSLSNSGADIIELNSVRKRLSSIKGGKLSLMSYPASVICLLVSDIVGNHDEFIASGPTFEDNDNPLKAFEILQKYKMQDSISDSIKEVLKNNNQQKFPIGIDVKNYVIGNNIAAITAGEREAAKLGYQTLFISDCVSGEVETLSHQYCRLICTIMFLLSDSIDLDIAEKTLEKLDCLNLSQDIISKIMSMKLDSDKKGIFLISGGEPTVHIKGKGKGGRNQELALRFASNFHYEREQIELMKKFNVFMLSAGTDGMDGPTDAAGAIAYCDLVSEAANKHLDIMSYLSNNDSYNFYRKFNDPDLHIKTGHTDTNVMDIHMIVIEPKKQIRLSIS